MDKVFNISLYDFISLLVPGAGLLSVIYATQSNEFSNLVSPEIMIPMFISLSIFLGMLFLSVGNLLYGTYIHPSQFEEGSIIHKIVKFMHNVIRFFINDDRNKDVIKKNLSSLIQKRYGLKSLNRLEIYQISDMLANKRYSDRGNLLSKEGSYRAFTVMFIVLWSYLQIKYQFDYRYSTLILFLILRILLWGHNYFRNIRRSQIYTAAFLKIKEENK